MIAAARPQEPYNKDQAVNYARTWVQNGGTPLRNPSYPDMSANASDGGDCTNFISQTLRAGGWRNTTTTSTTSDMLWWLTSKMSYSQTWTTTHGFFRHMNGGANPGTVGNSYESWYRWDFTPGTSGTISVNYGDIISADWQGNGIIDHTMIVTGFRIKPDGYAEVLVSYHSTDRKDLPISTIQAAYPNAKFYRFGPLNQNLIIQQYQIRVV
ncbi:MAG: amidase domain-containing protein [Patescibacteria group bacterium]